MSRTAMISKLFMRCLGRKKKERVRIWLIVGIRCNRTTRTSRTRIWAGSRKKRSNKFKCNYTNNRKMKMMMRMTRRRRSMTFRMSN